MLEERSVEVTDDRSRIVSEAIWTWIRVDVNTVPYRVVVVRSLNRQARSVSLCFRKASILRLVAYEMQRPVHERALVNVAAAGTRGGVYRRRIWHRDRKWLESPVAVRDVPTVA